MKSWYYKNTLRHQLQLLTIFCNILYCRCLTGFWICLGFWFWIYQGSEYARVTQGSQYTSICQNNFWSYQNMPEYAKICANVPKSAWIAFVLFAHCNSLSTWTLGYLFYRKLEVIVWRNTRQLSWRDKIQVFI